MNIFSKKAFYIAFNGLCYTICCFLGGLNMSWRRLNFRNNAPVLLFTSLFTKMRTLKFKSRLRYWFFLLPSIIITIPSNEPYEPQKHTKRMEISQWQTMTFWTRQVLFPKRSAKMIDCSKKCKCQLAFKLQNLHVFEKCSNTLLRHWHCFLSPAVTINDKDRHGLKVEKLGPTFSIFNPMTAEIS